VTGRGLAHRAALRMGRRGATLFVLGVADVIYGASLISSPGVSPNSTMLWFDQLGPMWLWTGLWWMTAVACFANVTRHDDRLGFAAALGIKISWMIVCLAGWLAGAVGLGAVGVFFGLTCIVVINGGWPEPHHAVAQWTEDQGAGDDQS
jgi:hypothetical protein